MNGAFSDNTRDLDRYLVRATHAARLERWLGTEEVEHISIMMRDWYGPPIPIAGVPGRVYACGGGDFCGAINGGYFGNLADYAAMRFRQNMRRAWRRSGHPQVQLNAGFSSLSDLISEMTAGGKKQVLPYNKTGIAQPAVGSSAFLWRQGILPSAGATAAAAPGGTVMTNGAAGSLFHTDAGAGDTLHFVNWFGLPTAAQTTTLMLYDHLYSVNINYNTTSNTVTGVPTRYQTATTAPGNFMSGNVTTALGATAQNITVTYLDRNGVSSTSPATPIRVSSAVDTIPHTAPTWNVPLQAGDVGIRAYTNIAFSAGNSGNVDRMIGHPIALMPALGVANQGFFVDGINSSVSFEQIYDGACLAFMEWFKSATGACSYNGYITLASG